VIPADHSARLIALGYMADLEGRLQMTQAVWKRFSSPKNCKQPGAMDLDATV
jgi:hypothetical protein